MLSAHFMVFKCYYYLLYADDKLWIQLKYEFSSSVWDHQYCNMGHILEIFSFI